MNTLTKPLLLCALFLYLCLGIAAQQRSIEDVINIIETEAPQLLRTDQHAFKSKPFGQKKELLTASSKIECLKALYKNLQNEAFYVFNAQSEGGFMIVSADERMQPILAYADNGSFDTDSLPANVKAWIMGYVIEANNLTHKSYTTNATQTSAAKAKRFTAPSTNVEPLITTKWGQRYPYNELCPTLPNGTKAVTGCVATAMAQIMNYYKSPTTGQGSNSYTTQTHGIQLSRDFSTTSFDWSMMKNTYSTSETAEYVQAIATLMLSCGIAVNMDYNTESGSTNINQMNGLLTYFGYDEDMAIVAKDYMSTDDWHTMLLSQLNRQYPLLIDANTPNGYGHAFIVDGYRTNGDDYPYYHINWGWNGQQNGYFLMSNMNPAGYEDDPFSLNLQVIINAKPDDGTTELPCFMQMESLTPNKQTVDLTKNEKLTITLAKLTNFSCQTFNGSVTICLEDGAGNSTEVYTLPVNGLPTSYLYSQINADCNVPSTLKSGEYTIAVYATPTGGTQRYPVTTGNDPGTISITNAENIFYPSIMTQNITVTAGSSNKMTLTAATIMNFKSGSAFSGSLQMAIADYTDELITTFGNVRTINGLPYMNYYSNDFTFNGTLPATIGDGAYKLYLGANQNGYTNWSYVQKYELDNGYITASGLDASTRLWINNGKATLEAPYITGDVNHDTHVNIADMSKFIRLFAANYQTKDLTMWSADLNENGSLDETDKTQLATCIIESTTLGNTGHKDALLNAGIVEHGGTFFLTVSLNNATSRFNALQFDLTLPTGVETAEGTNFTFTARATDHTSVMGNGRVLMFSTSDSDFSGSEGTVAYIPLKVNTTGTLSGTVTLGNIMLSDSRECEAVAARDITIDWQEDITSLSNAIAKVEAYPYGEKLGQYHTSAAFDAALTNARALAANPSADLSSVLAAITLISTDGITINTPAEGQFIHIKDSRGNYMTCHNTSGNRIAFSPSKDNATVFCLYGDGKLVAYQTGMYVGRTGSTDTYPVNETVVAGSGSCSYSFTASSVNIGRYAITFGTGTRYMSAGGGADTFDSPTDITDTNYDFTLEEAEAVTATISRVGFSTLFSPMALVIPEGVKAYTGTYSAESNTIMLQALNDKIPANTGVLIEGNPNTAYSFATAASDGESASSLTGTVPTITNVAGAYTLQVVDGKLGFYRFTGTSLSGFKAFFQTTSASKGFAILKDDDDIDGIHNSVTPATDGIIHDLFGNVVESPAKGHIYIRNGKKFLYK